MLYGVILAGGMGKRLWPESDRETPKPFLSRTGLSSLLDETITRIIPLIPPESLYISTAEIFEALTRKSVPSSVQIICEPISRNTAPAIALAALTIERRDPEGVMAVFPSDHYIGNPQKFRDLIDAASLLIDEEPNRLVTIGIAPIRPATGYGYIEAKEKLDSPAAQSLNKIAPRQADSFTEKPDRSTAEKYLAKGCYFWNAGIFVWKAKRILDLIAKRLPETASFILEYRNTADSSLSEIVAKKFPLLPSVSIDKGVLEKANPIIVLPASFDWNDLGTFEEFSKTGGGKIDDAGNNSLGINLTVLEGSENIVRSFGRPPFLSVYLAGLSNLLIVQKGEKLLIVPQGREDLIQLLAEKEG